MSDGFTPIRSYQRIFKPDRRIYQVDGRRLPVPGGVPLNWLAWAFTSLVVILVVSSRSLLFGALVGIVAGFLCGAWGWRMAIASGCVVFVCVQACGLLLDWIDWPLRLIVLPVLIATGAGQISADGRPAHRYVISRVLLRVRAGRRSLERPLSTDGHVADWAPRVWIAPDHTYPVLHHGRVHGPARLVFAERVVLTRRRGRHVVRRAAVHRVRNGDVCAHVVELAAGQVVEVRP
jgi:conjugation transfer TcpE-like protein